jgi:hypothetical protein
MTDQDTQNIDDQATSTVNRSQDELDGALHDLFGVGRMWASHGLTVGKVALQTSARALEITASTLETLAKQFDERQGEPESPSHGESAVEPEVAPLADPQAWTS